MNRFRLADVSFLLRGGGCLVRHGRTSMHRRHRRLRLPISPRCLLQDSKIAGMRTAPPFYVLVPARTASCRGVAWPAAFIDNRDGTVLDNLTGLLWLKNANCFGRPRTWQEALDDANNLADSQWA